MLIFPPDRASQMLGLDGQITPWPSLLYEMLARKELLRLKPKRPFEACRNLEGLDRIVLALTSRSERSPVDTAALVLRLLRRMDLDDHVVLKRVARELDLWAYRRAAREE